jgi:hypothetical protein
VWTNPEHPNGVHEVKDSILSAPPERSEMSE